MSIHLCGHLHTYTDAKICICKRSQQELLHIESLYFVESSRTGNCDSTLFPGDRLASGTYSHLSSCLGRTERWTEPAWGHCISLPPGEWACSFREVWNGRTRGQDLAWMGEWISKCSFRFGSLLPSGCCLVSVSKTSTNIRSGFSENANRRNQEF